MKIFIAVSAVYGALYASASPMSEAQADKSDWKYAVGWDGVTLPATDIGTTLHKNATDLEVRSQAAFPYAPADMVQKRNIGGVYICTDINWGGRCGYAVQPLGECIVLGSDWNKQISSFGPDDCTYCAAYEYVLVSPCSLLQSFELTTTARQVG